MGGRGSDALTQNAVEVPEFLLHAIDEISVYGR